MAHIIPPYYHHAKPVIFCFGRDFTPVLPASAAHPAARPHDLPHIRPAGLEPVRRCSAAGRPPPFGLCAERIRAAVPAARSAADQAGHAAACGRSAARCYRGQRNAAERSKRG